MGQRTAPGPRRRQQVDPPCLGPCCPANQMNGAVTVAPIGDYVQVLFKRNRGVARHHAWPVPRCATVGHGTGPAGDSWNEQASRSRRFRHRRRGSGRRPTPAQASIRRAPALPRAASPCRTVRTASGGRPMPGLGGNAGISGNPCARKDKSMTRKTGSMKWSALAIATAIVIAPVAYSGGMLDSFVLRGGVSPAAQNAASQAPNDRFIISYRKGARSLSAASANNILANAARETGVGIEPLRTLATGASLIRTDRKLDRAATKRLMVALQNDPNVLAE